MWAEHMMRWLQRPTLSRPETFCKLYQLPSMQSYATQRYGDNLSTQLASFWAAKMTFLYMNTGAMSWVPGPLHFPRQTRCSS